MTDVAIPAGAAEAASQREFETIFETYRNRVLGLCLHLVGNAADAEDAAQEALLAVYHGLPGFRGVHEALARLTAEHRGVLALFSLDGLSHREIAETLGIPEGTVWSRLHLARKKLAAELDALGFRRT